MTRTEALKASTWWFGPRCIFCTATFYWIQSCRRIIVELNVNAYVRTPATLIVRAFAVTNLHSPHQTNESSLTPLRRIFANPTYVDYRIQGFAHPARPVRSEESSLTLLGWDETHNCHCFSGNAPCVICPHHLSLSSVCRFLMRSCWMVIIEYAHQAPCR